MLGADEKAFDLVLEGGEGGRGELGGLLAEVLGEEDCELTGCGRGELFGEVDEGIADVPSFHAALCSSGGEAEGKSHKRSVLSAEDGVGLEVARGSGEEELFKLVIRKRINSSLACLGTWSDVRNEMINVFKDGLVAAEAGGEGEFGCVELALDIGEGAGVSTVEGVDGLVGVAGSEETAGCGFQHLSNRKQPASVNVLRLIHKDKVILAEGVAVVKRDRDHIGEAAGGGVVDGFLKESRRKFVDLVGWEGLALELDIVFGDDALPGLVGDEVVCSEAKAGVFGEVHHAADSGEVFEKEFVMLVEELGSV